MVTRADPPGRETGHWQCLVAAPPHRPLEPRLQHRLPSEQAGLDFSLLTAGDDPLGHRQRRGQRPAQGPQLIPQEEQPPRR